MSYHKCERCESESSVFWHTLGYGCTPEGDHAYKVFELCDKCLLDLIRYMKGERVKCCPKEIKRIVE